MFNSRSPLSTSAGDDPAPAHEPWAMAGHPDDLAIAGIARELNESLEFERVVQLIARHAVELLDAERGAVHTLDGDELVVVGSCGEGVYPPGTRQPVGGTFSGATARAARPLRTDDVCRDAARWPHSAAALPAGVPISAVAAPLLADGRPFGVICVFGREGRPFDARDERLLAQLADHAAIAAENARLYSTAARTARHASILATTARELARHVSPAALYAGLTQVATQMLGAQGLSVFLADPETRQVELAHSTLDPTVIDEALRRFWPSALGTVVSSGTPAFIEAADALWACPRAGVPASAALLPLEVEGRPRGVLALRFGTPQRFDETERRLLSDFGAQAAVALRNAMLVAALERRAARLGAVARAQESLPRPCLRDVYAELHRAVASVVDAPCFALLVPAHGADADDAAPDADADPDAAGDAGDARARWVAQHVVVDGRVAPTASLGDCPPRDALTAAACAAGRAVVESHPVWSLAAAVAPEPGREWRAAAAGLAAPLLHGDRLLGVLHVQSYTPGTYAAEDADLVAIIARQAGAAVELARLFDAQRREQQLAEAAAAVARVALGADGVRDAAGPVLEVLARLLPDYSLVLAARMDGGTTLEYVAATAPLESLVGLRAPFQESLGRYLRPDTVTHLDDVQAASHPDRRALAPALAAVLVPLVARQQILGFVGVGTPMGQVPPASMHETLHRLAAPVALAVDALLLGEEERRRTERERMLAAALATMDQPVFVLGPDERVRYANTAAVREYDHSLDELTGMPFDRLVRAVQDVTWRGIEMPRWVGAAGGLPAGALRLSQQVHRRRDGSEFPVAVTLGTIRDDAGAAVGQVVSVRNLTDERRVAEQLRQSEKLAALGSLVAGVAHELNNPLTGISAFSQLLMEEQLGDEQRESVRLIKREADRAVGVIRDLLLFSRKSEAHLGAVDVNALIQLTVRLRTYTLRSDDVTVELELDPAAPGVLGDEQRLQQVLLNLIVNAEYALHGRPVRRLTLRTRGSVDHVVIEVSDTGHGIEPDAQRHIFEPFFTTKPAGVGTGLGLSVSYGIVQAHGGTITVDSAPGQGCTFRITLPSSPSVPSPEPE